MTTTEGLRAHWRWIALAVAILILLSTFFCVGEGEIAIVTQFGRPVSVIRQPGLRLKWPWQSRIALDARLQLFNPVATELLTRDKKNLVVDSYVVWRVLDPRRFVQSVVDRVGAETRLQDVVKAELSIAIGSRDLSNLVSIDPAAVQIAPMMKAVTARCNAASSGDYGIEVVNVELRRVNLPEENKESVFARMRAERDRIARRYRAEGSEQATRIRSDADRQKTEILAGAYEKSERLRGEGDAKSTAVYAAAYNRDPGFYKMTRTLESYKRFLNEKTTVILSSDSDLMRLLTHGSAPDSRGR